MIWQKAEHCMGLYKKGALSALYVKSSAAQCRCGVQLENGALFWTLWAPKNAGEVGRVQTFSLFSSKLFGKIKGARLV